MKAVEGIQTIPASKWKGVSVFSIKSEHTPTYSRNVLYAMKKVEPSLGVLIVRQNSMYHVLTVLDINVASRSLP